MSVRPPTTILPIADGEEQDDSSPESLVQSTLLEKVNSKPPPTIFDCGAVHRVGFRLEIHAPIHEVWELLTDFTKYPQWNSFVSNVEGASYPPLEGSEVTFNVNFDDGSTQKSMERITKLHSPAKPHDDDSGTEKAYFEYMYSDPFLSKFIVGCRGQELEQSPGGPTTYHTWEEFGGVLNSFLPYTSVEEGIARQALEAKKHLESRR